MEIGADLGDLLAEGSEAALDLRDQDLHGNGFGGHRG